MKSEEYFFFTLHFSFFILLPSSFGEGLGVRLFPFYSSVL